MASPLLPLFQKVQRFSSNGDYDKALKYLTMILKEDPENAKALHCKVVCLIRQNEFESALDVTSKIPASSIAFERAYCLYRLNRVEEALDLLNSLKGKEASQVRIQELIAQSYYRLERYPESHAVYLKLIKNTMDDYGDERETNLAAVVASLALTDQLEGPVPRLGDQMYELCFNKACIDIGMGISLGIETKEGMGRLDEAKKKLQQAMDLCGKVLKEEEATEDEIEKEVGMIRTQMNQIMDKGSLALSLCRQRFKGRQWKQMEMNEVLKLLPPVEEIIKDVNVDVLESSYWSLGSKYVAKVAKETKQVVVDDKKKKRKKRKKILPKNYDPTVDPDPERWLPKWQRSTYKKKKDKRHKDALGRGTQGTAVSDTVESSIPPPKPSSAAASPRVKVVSKKKKGKR